MQSNKSKSSYPGFFLVVVELEASNSAPDSDLVAHHHLADLVGHAVVVYCRVPAAFIRCSCACDESGCASRTGDPVLYWLTGHSRTRSQWWLDRPETRRPWLELALLATRHEVMGAGAPVNPPKHLGALLLELSPAVAEWALRLAVIIRHEGTHHTEDPHCNRSGVFFVRREVGRPLQQRRMAIYSAIDSRPTSWVHQRLQSERSYVTLVQD